MKSLTLLAPAHNLLRWLIPSAAVMAAVSLSLSSQAEGAPQGLPAEVIRVTPQVLESHLEAVGSLKANNAVTLSTEMPGRLEAIPFKDGAEAKEGELLFVLNDASQKAQLKEAQARVRLSQVEFKRINKLHKQGAASETDRDSAQATLNINRAQADFAKAQLEKFSIKAPFQGVVGIHDFSKGDYLNAGQALVQLVDINTLKFDFHLPEIYLSQVKVGQSLSIETSAFPNKPFTGEVIAISPSIEEKGRSLMVRASIKNTDTLLRPGLFAKVKLAISRNEAAILLPEQALIPQGSQYFVMTVVDGTVNQVPVSIGQRKASQVEIVSGVNAEDVVITAGQLKLHHGAPVTPLFPPSQETTTLQAQAAQ